jgi:hypothetical protein
MIPLRKTALHTLPATELTFTSVETQRPATQRFFCEFVKKELESFGVKRCPGVEIFSPSLGIEQ